MTQRLPLSPCWNRNVRRGIIGLDSALRTSPEAMVATAGLKKASIEGDVSVPVPLRE